MSTISTFLESLTVCTFQTTAETVNSDMACEPKQTWRKNILVPLNNIRITIQYHCFEKGTRLEWCQDDEGKILLMLNVIYDGIFLQVLFERVHRNATMSAWWFPLQSSSLATQTYFNVEFENLCMIQ